MESIQPATTWTYEIGTAYKGSSVTATSSTGQIAHYTFPSRAEAEAFVAACTAS